MWGSNFTNHWKSGQDDPFIFRGQRASINTTKILRFTASTMAKATFAQSKPEYFMAYSLLWELGSVARIHTAGSYFRKPEVCIKV